MKLLLSRGLFILWVSCLYIALIAIQHLPDYLSILLQLLLITLYGFLTLELSSATNLLTFYRGMFDKLKDENRILKELSDEYSRKDK